MKHLLIQVSLDETSGRIATSFKHKGFSTGDYSIEQILLTIGILDNLKQQMLDKIKTQAKVNQTGVQGDGLQ
jgi:hypothetical protein